MAAIPPLTLARVIVIVLYALVLLVSYRWLIPRLPPTAKKLATIVFLALTLVIVLGLQRAHRSTYLLSLFYLNGEGNVVTAVGATQFALVAELALITAWLERGRPLWRRLYLVGLAPLFLYFAWDELDSQRVWLAHWELVYATIGAIVVAVTSVVAVRSPRHTWIWYICLLAGLAISAAGALLIEQLRHLDICRDLGLVHYSAFIGKDRCLVYLVEESLELLGIWLVLVAMLGLFSDVAAAPNLRLRCLLYAMPVLSFLAIVSFTDADLERVQRKIQASPADVTFESGVRLYGYQIEPGAEDNHLQVSLWLSALPFGYNGLGYSIHLLDPISATSLSNRDKFVSVSGSLVRGPWHLPVFRQVAQLEIAPHLPRNHMFLVVLTVWREQGDQFAPQKIVSSDQELLGGTQVVLGELVIPAKSAAPTVAPLAVFDKAFTLAEVDLPERVRAGETLAIPFAWRAQKDGTEDYAQFIHLGHEESDEWWVYDQQPLGPRLPTRLWYSGLADTEVWEIPLPPDLALGRYAVFTGLYRAVDLERLRAADATGSPFADGRVPLGYVMMEPA